MWNSAFTFKSHTLRAKAYKVDGDESKSFRLMSVFEFELVYSTDSTEFVYDYDGAGFYVFSRPSLVSYVVELSLGVRPGIRDSSDLGLSPLLDGLQVFLYKNNSWWRYSSQLEVFRRYTLPPEGYRFYDLVDPAIWSRLPRYSSAGVPLTVLYNGNTRSLVLDYEYHKDSSFEGSAWKHLTKDHVRRIFEELGETDRYGLVERWDLFEWHKYLSDDDFETYWNWFQTRYGLCGADEDPELKERVRSRFKTLSYIISRCPTEFRSVLGFKYMDFWNEMPGFVEELYDYMKSGYAPFYSSKRLAASAKRQAKKSLAACG